MPARLPPLSDACLPALAARAALPAYARAATRIGIVHFGPGAFHRAHQAAYIDDLLAIEPDWAICAVSLRHADVRDALRAQDGLYALALMEEAPRLRVVGSIRELLHAPTEGARVLERLVDPGVRLVTLTVTEKGYCLDGDRLDVRHPDILADLANPGRPTSAIGWLVAGLRERRRLGIAPYTVLSCDNLADNGVRLRRAVLALAHCTDPSLEDWIADRVAFPRSMVDSITPATDDELREHVSARLGVADAWPVQREAYAQWVVEDAFRDGRPPLERVGVTVTGDVGGYDRAKLRLLNGAHSTLAYLGSLMRIETVADAMRVPALAAFVERLMREDIAPTLVAPAGLDLAAYIDAILDRFRNPAIRHRLSQIAWDGSQKLPVRLFGTIADALASGRAIDRLCLPLAAWMRFVQRQAVDDVALVDPMAGTLAAIGRACNGNPWHDANQFIGLGVVFAPLAGDERFVAALCKAFASLGDGTPAAVARALATQGSR